MSTLKVDNLLNSAGNESPISVPGAAKAWVNFSGSTATIRRSFNVSSITENASGHYTVNWTTAFPSGDYAYNVTAIHNSGSSNNYAYGVKSIGSSTGVDTASVEFKTGYCVSTQLDACTQISVVAYY